jgi:branched-chain amino acid transport system substrate-binding protein
MRHIGHALAALAFAFAAPIASAQAPEKIKLGFMAAMSGPLGALGAEQKRGLEIALEHLNHRIGGIPVEIFTGDSKANPGAAMQELSRLVEKERVHLLTGVTSSNELLSVVKPITDAKVFLIGSLAGPAELAGEGCSPYYFNVSFQNAQLTTGVGAYLAKKGIKKLYLMGMDYAGSREHIETVRKGFPGEIVAEAYTPMAQLDYAADIAKIRASGADGVFVFYPGSASVTFVRQWAQAGMGGKIPLYSNLALTEPLVFAAQGKAAVGLHVSGSYFAAMDNPANRKFVEAFRAKFGRDPAISAATQYDAMMLIDAAVREVKGNVSNQDAFRAALRAAKFESTRGPFRFNTNHQPIHNNYMAVVEERRDGGLYLKPTDLITEASRDEHAAKCRMR